MIRPIYVADSSNDCLQVFDADGILSRSLTGEATVSKWGKEKLDANAEMWLQRQKSQGLEREKQFWSPSAVEVDDENRIFVAETVRSRVQCTSNKFLLHWRPPLRESKLNRHVALCMPVETGDDCADRYQLCL